MVPFEVTGDSLRDGLKLPDDELWEFAKERAQRRRQRAFLAEKARKEGRDFLELLKEADREDREKFTN